MERWQGTKLFVFIPDLLSTYAPAPLETGVSIHSTFKFVQTMPKKTTRTQEKKNYDV